MGCKGSKHALLDGGGCGARAPEPLRCSGLLPRHSVALRSSTLGTLSLDRATAAAAAVSFGRAERATTAGSVKDGAAGRCRSTRWLPASSPTTEEPSKRQRRAPPRTPTKTPARDPEEINVWELMEGLDSDDDDGVLLRSAAGSPEFDDDVLSAFRDALAEFSPPPPDDPVAVTKEEIQVFDGVVRARLDVFQQRIDDGRSIKNPPPPTEERARLPPPESAGRVVVYLTSLRGVRQTHEDCCAASTILAGYGVRVDERDLSMHAGYKDELRGALGLGLGAGNVGLPHVFVDGWHLGGAEEVRRMHESGELAEALDACEAAPGAAKEGSGLPVESCGGCGGARFLPCDVCSGSCKVFVEDEDGAGAFRRCPECNENGLVRCPIC
ncbi:hypothetical protein ACQ4PT_030793 [Festuca glaucescens]